MVIVISKKAWASLHWPLSLAEYFHWAQINIIMCLSLVGFVVMVACQDQWFWQVICGRGLKNPDFPFGQEAMFMAFGNCHWLKNWLESGKIWLGLHSKMMLSKVWHWFGPHLITLAWLQCFSFQTKLIACNWY